MFGLRRMFSTDPSDLDEARHAQAFAIRQRSTMRSAVKILVITGLAAVFAAALATAPATASESSFTEQGRAAGLTTDQINMLQARADAYMAKVGGTQVALNEIDLDGTATLTIALPGEAHPRSLAGQIGIQSTDVNCIGGADFLHFCAYRGANFTSDQIDMFACGPH